MITETSRLRSLTDYRRRSLPQERNPMRVESSDEEIIRRHRTSLFRRDDVSRGVGILVLWPDNVRLSGTTPSENCGFQATTGLQ